MLLLLGGFLLFFLAFAIVHNLVKVTSCVLTVVLRQSIGPACAVLQRSALGLPRTMQAAK